MLLGALALGVGTIDGEVHRADRSLPPGGLPEELPAEVLECAGCHLNPGLETSYRDADGKLHRDYIDATAYVASIHFRHDKRSCSACHEGDYSTFPHAAANPTPTCVDCHESLQEEYRDIDAMVRRSVHAPGGDVAFDCATCHSPHAMRPAREMSVRERNAGCVDCHEGRFNTSGLTLAQRHAWHPQAALHLDRVACIACHTHPDGTDYAFRHDIRPKEEATSDCYACHGPDTKMASYVGSFENGRPRPVGRSDLVRAWYLSGGTRNRTLDAGGLALVTLVLLGTSAHGAIRWAVARRRSA